MMPTALVIDDDRHSADLLCRLLALFSVTARPAYGARAALLAAEREENAETPSWDIIFLDISMPELDGFELLEHFRRKGRLKSVPVVMVSTDDRLDTVERARQAGVLNFIKKPPTLDALEQVLLDARLV